MKQEEDPIVTAISSAIAFVIVVGVLLMLEPYFREQPTTTTQHQPEPTEQYVDSLVCPD